MGDKKEQTKETKETELKEAINAIASTENGKIFFSHLAKICGFAESQAVMDINTKEINTISSLWNVAREGVYLDIRKYLSKENKIRIEL